MTGGPLHNYCSWLQCLTLALAVRQNVEVKSITTIIGEEDTKHIIISDNTTAILSDCDSGCTPFILLNIFN